MEHFVTIFDQRFMPQGLALHRSMSRHLEPYTLWILCMDLTTFETLSRLQLRGVRLLRLEEFETESLRRVRPNRSIGEYCWTLTPWAPRFVFESDASVERVTYVDADLWFRKRPDAIFHEFDQSGRSVLITDHAFAPEHDQSDISGQFCVQFISFKRGMCEPIRSRWESQCLEWCHARVERGRFGDQKYLDEWPDRNPAMVHVLQDRELTLAPWNVTRFPFGRSVFYHFHGLRLTSRRRACLGQHPIPKPVLRAIYQPYLRDLSESIASLDALGVPFEGQVCEPGFWSTVGQRMREVRFAVRNLVRQHESNLIVPLPTLSDQMA